VVLERLGGQVENQRRRREHRGHIRQRRQADMSADLVDPRAHDPHQGTEHDRAEQGVAQPPAGPGGGPEAGAERRRVA